MKQKSATKRNTELDEIARTRKLTIGMDLGDRVSRYCMRRSI